LGFLAEEGLIEVEEAKAALGRIETTTDVAEAVGEVQYVQESVFEEYETKKRVFKEMDAAASADTLLASSSSGLFMTIIQSVTSFPERCVVVHPFLPPYLMPLVEIVPGTSTSTETVETARCFMRELGRVPVVLKKEVNGFLANRLAAAVWREAIDLVDNDVASLEDVDKAFSMWALNKITVGPLFHLHLAGGAGGVEHNLEHIIPTFTFWWKSMNAWTSISDSAKKKLVEGIKESAAFRNRTYEELVRWSDKKLIEVLKVITPEG
jgi:3-hydroxypropionate dehydrogenase (NADP+)